MNAAQQIVKSVSGEMNSMDYSEALEFCSEMMDAVEQNFEEETTIFEAADGSKLNLTAFLFRFLRHETQRTV